MNLKRRYAYMQLRLQSGVRRGRSVADEEADPLEKGDLELCAALITLLVETVRTDRT